MRWLARLALACPVFLMTVLAQSNQEADSNMSCVERLQMPVYPRLAQQARITGSVTATAVIASDGSLQTTATGYRLLAEAVENAIRASVFLKTCGGKSVHSDPGKRLIWTSKPVLDRRTCATLSALIS